MPTTIEDLVWYIMCATITGGFPTIIVIALNIQKLLQGVLIEQASQRQWITDHKKTCSDTVTSLWKAIDKLERSFNEMVK